MEIVMSILALVIQVALYIYLVLFMPQIFTKKKYSKLQVILTCVISIANIVVCSIIKTFIPFLNLLVGLLFIFANFKYVLKVNLPKSILLSIITFIFVFLAEIFSFYAVLYLFDISQETLNSNFYYYLALIAIQCLTVISLSRLSKYLVNKHTNMISLINRITSKHLIIFFITISICAIPQLLLFIFNNYEYPLYFFIINTIQIIVIFCIIFFYTTTSLQKDKAESDLVTTKLHNNTMTGMIDGVKTLKHDYNNIMQALNGYVSTKQYDKLQEHVNKVLKECNIVNTLGLIDPKVFNDPAIYGIVGAKYFLITEADITMDLEIVTIVNEINFPMPELSRILGILLDNAFEATQKSETPYVKLEMRFDNRKCADIIRVINTYDTNINIDLENMYKKGFSSKKIKSGIGLWEVKKIISKIPHAQIYPTIEKNKFVQNIVIEKDV